MGVKCFCDKCGNEIKTDIMVVPMYAYDGLGNVIVFIKNNYLCEECTKKFNMIKDRLEHEEDFFDMSDKDISLMEYDFKVGDKVITSTGKVGIIKSICNCKHCKERGFYEPEVEVTAGVGAIWITNIDKENGFKSFYQIGSYKFGNIDKESIKYDIESETCNIEESNKRLKEYQKQLERMSVLSCQDLIAEMTNN